MKPKKILIIEDREDTALVLKEFLADEGFKVDMALSGREALTLFQKHKHDILITDFRLPDTDGVSLMQACKKVTANFKIIYLTGVNVRTQMSQVREGPACKIISKPARPSAVLMAVEEMLT